MTCILCGQGDSRDGWGVRWTDVRWVLDSGGQLCHGCATATAAARNRAMAGGTPLEETYTILEVAQ